MASTGGQEQPLAPRALTTYERMLKEFPGSSLGSPRTHAQGFVRRGWAGIRSGVADETLRNMLDIFIQNGLNGATDDQLMELVDHIRTIKARTATEKALGVVTSEAAE